MQTYKALEAEIILDQQSLKRIDGYVTDRSKTHATQSSPRSWLHHRRASVP